MSSIIPTIEHALGPVDLVQAMQFLNVVGLNTGSAGNVSCRVGNQKYLITPSGVESAELTPESIVRMPQSAADSASDLKPSSEAGMHADIYAKRPEVYAIAHTHSPYATALACTRKPIPAFHYMVAIAGGDSIRCAPYATFGSKELSDNAVCALHGRNACLLANHGVLALGADPLSAAKLALEIEQLAKQYCIAMQCGEPVILDEAQMIEVLEKFKSYGQRVK
jgi:L-fuculose-phosphate aldolase